MRYITSLSLILLLSIAGVAKANTYHFACDDVNSATNCATGAAQFVTNVTGDSSGAVFEFRNIGSGISTITDIYFDDDPLAMLNIGSASLTAGTGVAFTSPAAPPSPPPATGFDASYSADSDSPGVPANGINQAAAGSTVEFLQIGFDYANGGTTFAMLLAALNDGRLNIALHAQAIGTGSSETSEWLYLAPSPVPVPAAVWLFGTALLGFIGMSRRTKV